MAKKKTTALAKRPKKVAAKKAPAKKASPLPENKPATEETIPVRVVAERQLGHAEEAKKAYARAHSLDPDYIFAGRQLADIQMELGEFDQAAATTRRIAPECVGLTLTFVQDGVSFTWVATDLDCAALDAIQQRLRARFGEVHATVQIEQVACGERCGEPSAPA